MGIIKSGVDDSWVSKQPHVNILFVSVAITLPFCSVVFVVVVVFKHFPMKVLLSQAVKTKHNIKKSFFIFIPRFRIRRCMNVKLIRV